MRRRRAEVWRPRGLRHLGGQPLELPATDVFEVLASRVRRGLLIEVHGERETLGDLGGDRLRQRHARCHGHALDGNERHHVDRAQAGVLAFMGAQVDGGNRAFEQLGNARRQGGGRSRQREHRAVVRGIRLDVEDPQAGDRAQRVGQAGDDVAATPFADVGDTFDGRHGYPL